MSLNVYLYFDGQCADAFAFYKSVFGGEFVARQTFGDGPPELAVADTDKDRIMHVTLPVGEAVLMGSDTISNQKNPPRPSNAFSVSFTPKSKNEADRVFTALTAGGTINMPLAETFWGSYFGTGTDKFGVNWMVNLPLNQTPQ